MAQDKKVHLYKPHVYTNQAGREFHRLTICAIEIKPFPYTSSTIIEQVTCERCLKENGKPVVRSMTSVEYLPSNPPGDCL